MLVVRVRPRSHFGCEKQYALRGLKNTGLRVSALCFRANLRAAAALALSSSANSNHTMLSPLPRSGRDAQIFVKTLTGRKKAFLTAPMMLVFRLKQHLEATEGIPVDAIRLIYSGKQLADDKPLAFYNIQAGGTIHMVAALGWLRKLPSPSVLARKKARESLDPFLASDSDDERPVPDLPRPRATPLARETQTLRVVENPDLVQNVAEFLDEDGCNRALVCHAWRNEIRTVRWRRAEDRRRALQRRRELDARRLAEAKFARDRDALAQHAMAYANDAETARRERDAALSRCDCAERRAQRLSAVARAEGLAKYRAQREAAGSVAAAAAEVLRPRCSGIDAMSVRGLSDAALDQLLADAQAAQAVLAREQQRRLDAERDKHLCVVCLQRPKEYAPSACGHFALCEACMPRVDSCPICRIPTDPEDWNRVYA